MTWSEVAPYLLIAPMTAGVGWLTNLIGIKMMFYPVNYVGFGQYFGWQGIIPRLRIRLVRSLVNISVAKICSPKEVFSALDDEEVLANIQKLIHPYIEDWIEDILAEENIRAWEYTPEMVKKVVLVKVKEKLPEVARNILDEFSDKADLLIDFTSIAESQIRDRPELLNELFLRCAGNELRFVIRSGLYFGFPLGCLQALLWYVYPFTWVLPLFGCFVGAGTNWIALKMIAHPANPIDIGPIKIQGLYLRRQKSVSKDFAETFTNNLMSPAAFIDHLWGGPKSMEVHRIVHRHVRKALDKNILGKLVAQMAVSPSGFESLKAKSIEYTANRMRETVGRPEAQQELSKPIIDLIEGRMARLRPKEFQQLLLPAFEQDQTIIVLLGAALGFLVGLSQLFWLFDIS